MSDVGEVNPDLVGAAAMKLRAQEIGHPEARHHEEIGAGGAPIGPDRHPLPVGRGPPDRRLHDRGRPVQVPPREDGVRAPDLPGGERRAEPAVREIGPGHDEEPAGVAVEAVHDAGAARGPAGKRRAARHQRVDQRVVPVTRRRMHHQAGGLVEHGEVVVLVDDGEGRGVRRQGAGRLVLGKGDLDQVAPGGLPRSLGHPAVDPHRARGDEACRPGAGKAQLIGEKTIEALGSYAGDGEGDGGQGPAQAEDAASRRVRRASSSQSEIASAMAPQLTPMSAMLNVGQR